MRWVLALLLLAACAAPCETPMEYLVQSNCPFGAAAIDGRCAVVCPLWNHTGAVACAADADCDCAERAGRSLDCRCVDGACVSVEAYPERE